jgi:hypothetical protein
MFSDFKRSEIIKEKFYKQVVQLIFNLIHKKTEIHDLKFYKYNFL